VGDLVRRYPLSSYFVIAYAGTWLAWAFFVLSRDGSGLLPFHSPSSYLILIGIGTFSGPTLSGCLPPIPPCVASQSFARASWRPPEGGRRPRRGGAPGLVITSLLPLVAMA
jgi:hypothetical protein